VEDIAFRVLAADNQPNFRTISDFRKIRLKTLEGLFEQVLKIAGRGCIESAAGWRRTA
jgi:transposase